MDPASGPAVVPEDALIEEQVEQTLPEPTLAELSEAGEKEFVELGSEAEA